MASLRQQAVAGGKWTAFSAGASIVIQLLQLTVLGRLLAPSDFGLMAMMTVVIGAATSIADFGIGNYLIQAEKISRRSFWHLFALCMFFSAILISGIYYGSSALAFFYNSLILKKILPWFGLTIFISTAGQIFCSLLQRALRFKHIALSEFISNAASFLCSCLLAWHGYGVWSLIFGQIILNTAKCLLYSYTVFQLLETMPRVCNSEIRKILRFGLFQTGERIANFIGWNADKIIIGRLLGSYNVGIYSIAFQLMMRPFSLLNPIFVRVALPILSQMKNDNQQLRKGYIELIRTIALISFPLYIGSSISAPAIISILIGKKWLEAVPVFSVLCGLGLFFSIGNPIGTLILAKGRSDLSFYLNLFALFLYIIAYYIGSFFGIMGVAVSFLITVSVFLYPFEFYLRWKLIGMSAREYFSALKHHFIGMIIPLGLVYLSLNNQLSQNSCYQLLAGGCGAGLFLGYLWLTDQKLIATTYSLIFYR